MKLTTEQIRHFDQQGYLVLKNVLAPELIAILQQATEQLQTEAFAALKQNRAPKDFAFSFNFFIHYLNRVTQFHRYADISTLAVLGSPALISIAKSLCTEHCLPTADMLIVKNQHDDLTLPWHQDLIFDADKYRVIAVGIYLDEAKLGDGTLKLVKGSQSGKQDIDRLMQASDLEIIEVAAAAGDIVIHNPMLVHWSEKLKNQPKRRTLYYEFRPLEQVQKDACWPPQAIAQRQQLWQQAMVQFQNQDAEKQSLSKQTASNLSKATTTTTLEKCYQIPLPQSQANFAKAVSDQLVKKASEEDRS